jgi:hypothetical protein
MRSRPIGLVFPKNAIPIQLGRFFMEKKHWRRPPAHACANTPPNAKMARFLSR